MFCTPKPAPGVDPVRVVTRHQPVERGEGDGGPSYWTDSILRQPLRNGAENWWLDRSDDARR
jgi:hypothetical protein